MTSCSRPWYFAKGDDDRVYLYRDGERIKAWGNFRDEERPLISHIKNAKRFVESGVEYIVVSYIVFPILVVIYLKRTPIA